MIGKTIKCKQLRYLGLTCTNINRTPPEQCLCNDTLCNYWEYCYFDNDNEGCYNGCNGFPHLISSSCVCNQSLCTSGQCCGSSPRGCYIPPPCPSFPENPDADGCLCTNTRVCTQDQVCYDDACIRLPAPCSHDVNQEAGGCFCETANSICKLGEECRTEDQSCQVPVMCDHPNNLGLNITSNYPSEYFFLANKIATLTCLTSHYLYTRQVLLYHKIESNSENF